MLRQVILLGVSFALAGGAIGCGSDGHDADAQNTSARLSVSRDNHAGERAKSGSRDDYADDASDDDSNDHDSNDGSNDDDYGRGHGSWGGRASWDDDADDSEDSDDSDNPWNGSNWSNSSGSWGPSIGGVSRTVIGGSHGSSGWSNGGHSNGGPAIGGVQRTVR